MVKFKEIKVLEDDLVVYEKERKIVQKATSYIKILKVILNILY